MHGTDSSLFLRRLGQWTLICSGCAIPSAIWTQGDFHPVGMICGVAVFIVAYAFATSRESFARFHGRRGVRATLRVGFGTRLVVSLLFPLGMAVDLYPGLASIRIVGELGFAPSTIEGTFLTTLLQGTLLNVMLGVFMLPVYGFARFVARNTPPDPNACATCGYDIRGSREFGRCPECGGAIAAP